MNVAENYISIQKVNGLVQGNILDMLYSAELGALCQCTYNYEGNRHVFYYNIAGLRPITQKYPHMNFKGALDLLYSASILIELRMNYGISFENILLDKNYIYVYGDDIKFLYEPVQNKNVMPAKKFVLKLISLFQIEDNRIDRAMREIKMTRSDAETLGYIQYYLNSFAYFYRRK